LQKYLNKLPPILSHDDVQELIDNNLNMFHQEIKQEIEEEYTEELGKSIIYYKFL